MIQRMDYFLSGSFLGTGGLGGKRAAGAGDLAAVNLPPTAQALGDPPAPPRFVYTPGDEGPARLKTAREGRPVADRLKIVNRGRTARSAGHREQREKGFRETAGGGYACDGIFE